jgi:hypothetical protein
MSSDAADFAAFCQALAQGDGVVAALVAGQNPAPYHILLDHAAQFQFEVASPEAWQRPLSQMKWQVLPSVPVQIHITLPPVYAAAAPPPGWDIGQMARLKQMTGMLAHLLLARPAHLLQAMRGRRLAFYVSCEDGCDDPGTVTLSRYKGRRHALMPDTFYFASQGYSAHLQRVAAGLVPFAARRDQAVWRGATTGSLLSKASLFENRRVALAVYCAGNPDLFDVKLSALVQTLPAERDEIEAMLRARALLGGWMEMARFADYKFAIHIDGNTSAAGFFEKFALGCCVLRVASVYEQWFEPRLQAWTHFVPVAADLSDLREVLWFLIKHPALAETIAQAGFEFAVAADAHHEAGWFIEEIVKEESSFL